MTTSTLGVRRRTLRLDPDGFVHVHCSTCDAVFDTDVMFCNAAIWASEQAGWSVTAEQDPIACCPRCIARGEGPGRWDVYCHTCEGEESVATKDEAEEWKRTHRCQDWFDPFPRPDVVIKSPQDREKDRLLYKELDEKRAKERAERQEIALREAGDLTLASMIREARQVWWRRILIRLATWGKG